MDSVLDASVKKGMHIFFTLRSVLRVATEFICDDSDGPGHAPPYLGVSLSHSATKLVWYREYVKNNSFCKIRLSDNLHALQRCLNHPVPVIGFVGSKIPG